MSQEIGLLTVFTPDTTAESAKVNSNFDDIKTACNAHFEATAGEHGVTGAFVGTTNTQTLTNKTLTSPAINGATIDATSTCERFVPVATVLPFAGISAPTGFLMCQGASSSRTTYSALYAAITADKGTCTISIATPGVVTNSTHGLLTGDMIELTTTGALPTGLSANTNYYVIYVDANTFRLATTLANAIAGTAIATSGTQSGTHNLRFTPHGIDGATNFLLPDTRGASPTGAGTSTFFTQNETLSLGRKYDDQMQQITGNIQASSASGLIAETGTATGAFSKGTSRANRANLGTAEAGYDIAFDSANSTDARTGTVTKGKQFVCNFIIKY